MDEKKSADRLRADAAFEKVRSSSRDGDKVLSDRDSRSSAIDEKTARLKAQRLAKESQAS